MVELLLRARANPNLQDKVKTGQNCGVHTELNNISLSCILQNQKPFRECWLKAHTQIHIIVMKPSAKLCNDSVTCTHSTIQDGKTALRKASIRGHHKIVELLLKAGANPDLQDKVSREHSITYKSSYI